MTVEDPWASAAPEPEQPAPSAPTTVVNNSTAPRDAEAITTTFKGGRDFDAPWVVTRAATVAEADALLDAAFKDYLDKVQRVASVFAGAAPAPTQSGGGQQAQQRSAPAQSRAPQGATEPPSWFPPPPAEDWVYKTGIKNGNVWHAWAPPRKGGGDWEFHKPPRS